MLPKTTQFFNIKHDQKIYAKTYHKYIYIYAKFKLLTFLSLM